jgi:hypothetical protein
MKFLDVYFLTFITINTVKSCEINNLEYSNKTTNKDLIQENFLNSIHINSNQINGKINIYNGFIELSGEGTTKLPYLNYKLECNEISCILHFNTFRDLKLENVYLEINFSKGENCDKFLTETLKTTIL